MSLGRGGNIEEWNTKGRPDLEYFDSAASLRFSPIASVPLNGEARLATFYVVVYPDTPSPYCAEWEIACDQRPRPCVGDLTFVLVPTEADAGQPPGHE